MLLAGKNLRRIAVVALLVLVIVLWLIIGKSNNPIPQTIRAQADFKTVYPPASMIDQGSVSFSSQTLSFNIRYINRQLSVTEQPYSGQLDNTATSEFSGLHPVDKFTSHLGNVTITNFYSSSSLASSGQAAILTAGKTLVIIHPSDNKQMSVLDWKNLIDSLGQ